MTTRTTGKLKPRSAGAKIHRTDVLVVGSGFSGLGMAMQLRKAGLDDFLIIEKAHDIGGTWRDNVYPGCACDVPSYMYSYSFEPRTDWTKVWAGQQEIQDYLTSLATKYDLYSRTHFGCALASGYWDEAESRWRVTTSDGSEYVARFLISGIGALHVPNIPDIKGQDTFNGQSFHSAHWDHESSLEGKRVAVIGTGASAIQFVPKIAPLVSELQLYQRTPAWVLPRKNFSIPGSLQKLFGRAPLLPRILRSAIYWSAESLAVGLNGHSNLMRPIEYVAKRNIAGSIDDLSLRKRLTPDYRIGCKRILGSNDYYPALNLPSTTVITDGIAEIKNDRIVSMDGQEREVDVIIYATGFHVTDGFDSLKLKGSTGLELASHWNDNGINTHLGITAAGFPNLFFLLGPNTGLGHNSVVFMIECQIKYVLEAIRLTSKRHAEALTVRQSVQDNFNSTIQRKLANGVWTNGGCTSWYLDSNGVNRTVWPGFTWQYWLQTRKVSESDFELTGRPESSTSTLDTVGAHTAKEAKS